ncbi:MAG: HepT-like ribonuclease domain-containing protein, partial [Chloroflexota bacterium]
FHNDPKTQDAVVRNFEIIGEVVKRLPAELLSQQSQIPWRAIAGFRDVLIHDYAHVDLDEVWRTIKRDLLPLREAVEALLEAQDQAADDDSQE